MQTWIVAAACCAVGLVLGAIVALRWQRLQQRRLAQARQLRGKRGEALAEALLERHGYDVIDRQRRMSYALRTGAKERCVELVFDFVVMRNGEELVAEVKTGPTAVQLKHADTRRQLLEYQLASRCSHVLLVDPERGSIDEVSFPIPELVEPQPNTERAPDSARIALLLLVCAAAVGWVLLRGH